MSSRVKEEHKFIVSVKSEYAAGYDPVKDEETDEEEDELLDGCTRCQPIKNEDDVNVKADNDDDTDDECCLGKLIYLTEICCCNRPLHLQIILSTILLLQIH